MIAPRNQHDGRPHSLYILTTDDSIPIYVGVTCDLEQRLRRHAREKAWWPLVGRIRVEVYPDRHHGFRAERLAIWWFDPLRNVSPGDWAVPEPAPDHDPQTCAWCIELRNREGRIREIQASDDAPGGGWWAWPEWKAEVAAEQVRAGAQ